MFYVRIFLSLSLALLLTGCFTGVESTPRITYNDVKKEKIDHTTPEQQLFADVCPEPPSQWTPGKAFYVTDPKISIIFTSMSSDDKENLQGQDIYFHSMSPATTVTGDEITEIEFVTEHGGRLFYRDNMRYSTIGERQQLDVPFTIERSVIDTASQRLAGQTYYVVPPLWYTADGQQAVDGLRHIPVHIDQVVPGNAIYPLRVIFTPDGDTRQFSMYMTIGNQRTSTRNFDTLFSFTNPRERYPQITDQVWRLIIHSQVQKGMSRDECRLALGAPQTIGQRPTTAGMVEYWSYSDGIYLLFEDGFLSYFRR